MVFYRSTKGDRVPRQEVLRRKRVKALLVKYMHEGARTRAKTNDRIK